MPQLENNYNNSLAGGPGDDTALILTLPDGRKLGYAEFGSRSGKPVIVNHGLGSSRLDGMILHEIGLELGARIIGVDRPGLGLSSPHPSRTLLDFVEDVDSLTEQLQLPEYTVMGLSGGGPSTLACAKMLPPAKLKAVALVVALGPPDIGMQGATLLHRLVYPYALPYMPYAVHRWFWQRDALGRVDLSDEERLEMLLQQVEARRPTIPEKDRDAMEDIEFHKKMLKTTRQAFAQGYDGVLQDAVLFCQDFGFKVEDIRKDLPVFLWYGKQDVNVPGNHGVQLAKRLGEKATLRLEDETHISMVRKYKREIVEALLKEIP